MKNLGFQTDVFLTACIQMFCLVEKLIVCKNDGLMVVQANLLQAEFFPFFTQIVLTVAQKLHIHTNI